MNGMLKPLGFAAAATAGSLGAQIPLQPANLNPGLLKLRPAAAAAAPAGLTAASMCALNGQLNGLNGLSNGLTAANGLSTGATINGFGGWTTLPQL